jgi:hypothetical protein
LKVLLGHIDGSLPNLALMRLAAFHGSRGDDVILTRQVERTLFDPQFDKVYGSAIFKFSAHRTQRFQTSWPDAVMGGTGTDSTMLVDAIVGDAGYDYSIYPQFRESIGFTQRGCRLKCKFCVVPMKEGKNRSVSTVNDIWRGEGFPKRIHLLDNDFFGQEREQWQARIAEIRDGDFQVCISQGINTRLIDDESAQALATIDYRDTHLKHKRLYTAWDNLGDERIFFDGVARLEKAGVPPKHLMAYMLIGFDPKETWERIWHRFNRMVDAGISPYPMVYDRSRTDLISFQRWVIAGIYRFVKWDEYKRSTKSAESVEAYRAFVAQPNARDPSA